MTAITSAVSANPSLSVWREWIEIDQELSELDKHMSPSVWREWIEISGQIKHLTMNAVSLRVEGVD